MKFSLTKRLLILWGAFFIFSVSGAQAEDPSVKIKKIYQSESERIGKKDPNPQLTKTRLEEAARGFSAEDLDWLSTQALNQKESGDFRVFSVFLLALNGGEQALSKLKAIALSEMTKPNAADKEVREQAIKGIGKFKNPKAREALLEIETEQKDLSLQDRAHQALFEFETGRPEPKPIIKAKKKGH